MVIRLVDRGPHRVTVEPIQVTALDAAGDPVESHGPPVTVTNVRVQPLVSSYFADAHGDPHLVHQRRLSGSGGWPGGHGARVVWKGSTFVQEGEAVTPEESSRTEHFVVTLSLVNPSRDV